MLDCMMNRMLNRLKSRSALSLLCGLFMGLAASTSAWALSNGANGTNGTNSINSTNSINGHRAHQDVLEDSMRRGGCMLCHRWTRPWIGPSFNEIAQRYRHLQGEQRLLLVARLRNGSVGNHSPIPMGPCDVTRISDEELRAVIDHVLDRSSSSSTSSR